MSSEYKLAPLVHSQLADSNTTLLHDVPNISLKDYHPPDITYLLFSHNCISFEFFNCAMIFIIMYLNAYNCVAAFLN